ncbi:MAG: nucleoside phosphorylase [Kiritimatiellae bacterium]|nr:nucleoside phosphorylase [Kiritimatiellia bacterium]MCO5044130.1 nucleoside phosphorylase [Kiritimatiellia bacterium]MCO5061293.1 nucleoside phosphorylase [Kiritimatiellia bacterium]MCO5067631.1 nucleoside phosphorylase [Kiritimatiellia bacterium]MCO6400197.1 nucleoside phosphorylase [Verrucomicrobiota bacterium]
MKKNAQIITGLGEGDVAGYAFLPGDPGRVPKISEGWDDLQEVCRVREYVVHTGTVQGVRMTAASTGIGGPSLAILVEEMAKLGTHTFIRLGNSGAIADQVQLGDYVISTGAVRDEGTSRSYVGLEYPAVADYRVVSALVEAASESGERFHTGLTVSVDGFYSRNKVYGPNRSILPMSFNGYEQSGMNDVCADWKRARVLNVEMESATLFTMANLFGLRAGTICTVSDRTPWSEPGQDALSLDRNIRGAIKVAIQAVLKLDRAR